MKCLKRNKRKFWYSLYRAKVSNTYNGFETGEVTNSYSEPVPFYANISPASGRSTVEMFGNELNYDKVIVTDWVDIPIDENSILFIDHEPEKDSANNWIYDYVVKRVSRSLNSVSIAVSRRDVS